MIGKVLRVQGCRWCFYLIFLGVTVVSLLYFYNLQKMRFHSEFKRSSQVLAVFLDGLARSISTGYFQWDDFYEALVSHDEDFINENLAYVEEDFPYVRGARIINRPVGIEKDGFYFMKSSENKIFIYFNVWDSACKRVIEDKVARVEVDLSGLLKALNISEYFTPDPQGNLEMLGVRFISNIPFLRFSQILFSVFLGFVTAVFVRSIIWLYGERLTKIKLLEKISFIMEEKDPYTQGHSKNVALISLLLANRLGLSEREKELIREAALFHDIGKIGIPNEILNKKGKLTPEEFEAIKKHPLIGYTILSDINGVEEIAEIVKYHHERLDGSGYPEGLKGEEIPFGARLIAVADVFDALISDRPYRSAFSPEEAIEIMEGMPLDQRLVKALKDIYKEVLLRLKGANEGGESIGGASGDMGNRRFGYRWGIGWDARRY
ncbi:MAG: HD-GYP domain-containing protein [Synergistetes bacterium]|nr:HD-GYP domain-containing protein [Synergistota bacterium]